MLKARPEEAEEQLTAEGEGGGAIWAPFDPEVPVVCWLPWWWGGAGGESFELGLALVLQRLKEMKDTASENC